MFLKGSCSWCHYIFTISWNCTDSGYQLTKSQQIVGNCYRWWTVHTACTTSSWKDGLQCSRRGCSRNALLEHYQAWPDKFHGVFNFLFIESLCTIFTFFLKKLFFWFRNLQRIYFRIFYNLKRSLILIIIEQLTLFNFYYFVCCSTLIISGFE